MFFSSKIKKKFILKFIIKLSSAGLRMNGQISVITEEILSLFRHCLTTSRNGIRYIKYRSFRPVDVYGTTEAGVNIQV